MTTKTNQQFKQQTKMNARPFGKLLTLCSTVLIASCITVNVNFPESAVQHAANDFVKDLYKTSTVADASANANAQAQAVKDSVKKSGKKKKTKNPAPIPSPQPDTSWQFSFLNSAFAQEINTSTPKAKAIRAKMSTRVSEISELKAKGVLCESDDGMLKILDPSKAGSDVSSVAKLVRTENDDRDNLYQEIQESNRITDRKQTKIRKFFAAAFREHSPPACR